MYFVYILKCSDNSLYTGITSDLERRIKEHDWLLPWWAKYTSSRRPVELLYFEKERITDKKNEKIKKNKIDFWKKILKLTFLNEKRIIW